MKVGLPYEGRGRADVDADVNSAPAVSSEDQPKSPRRRWRLRWKHPITDGPYAESKEMLGGGSLPPSPLIADS